MTVMPMKSAVTVMLVLLLFWTAPPASATSVVSSFPSNGSSVPELPTTLVVTFSDDLAATASAAVAGPDGPIAVTPVTSGHDLIVELPSRSPAGGYSLTWTVTPVGGAALSGTLAFTAERPAGEAPVVPPPGEADPEPTSTAPINPAPSVSEAPAGTSGSGLPATPGSPGPVATVDPSTPVRAPDSGRSSPSLTSGTEAADTSRGAGRIWPAVVALTVATLVVAGLWVKRRNNGA